MKVSITRLVIGAIAVSATALPRPETRDTPSTIPKITLDSVPGLVVTPPQIYPYLFDSNGKLQIVTGNGNYTAPKSLVADVQVESPKVFKDGALRKKIRYGPFRLPGIRVWFIWIVMSIKSKETPGSQLAEQDDEPFGYGRCLSSKDGKAVWRMYDKRT